MKTWQAILAHIGITALQVFAARPILNGNDSKSALGNVGIQVGAQLGLSLLQGLVATANSNSDPNGVKLEAHETVSGGAVYKSQVDSKSLQYVMK
jgi:hypothetical protein